MKIWIGTEDVSESLGRDVAVLAGQRASLGSPRFHDPRVSALSLRECRSETEFLSRFMQHLRWRHGATAEPFDIPRRPGVIGAFLQVLRRFLWKLLRYQHDRMVFQQNMINEMIIHGLEFEMESSRQRISALESELARLKRNVAKP